MNFFTCSLSFLILCPQIYSGVIIYIYTILYIDNFQYNCICICIYMPLCPLMSVIVLAWESLPLYIFTVLLSEMVDTLITCLSSMSVWLWVYLICSCSFCSSLDSPPLSSPPPTFGTLWTVEDFKCRCHPPPLSLYPIAFSLSPNAIVPSTDFRYTLNSWRLIAAVIHHHYRHLCWVLSAHSGKLKIMCGCLPRRCYPLLSSTVLSSPPPTFGALWKVTD